MNPDRSEIRIALPSRGRIAEDALDLLRRAGLEVHKPNPRQYRAGIPALPELTVLFQRAADIAVSVRDGSVDFGITGWDVVSERRGVGSNLLPLQPLNCSHCRLEVIVPEAEQGVSAMGDLGGWQARLNRPLRIATKFPLLTRDFFAHFGLQALELVEAEGTLEIAPTIGFADLIVDLVSTGTTLRDNRLKTLEDGLILESQAYLIANRAALKQRPEALRAARTLLEYVVAYLRAAENVSIFANVRGDSPEEIAALMFEQSVIGGLQGPTIGRVFSRDGLGWHDIHIIVRKDQLAKAIAEIRAVGGSGVVVTPIHYIFEEEPQAYRAMLAALKD
jgi:ATP phosphoribosyltransferase